MGARRLNARLDPALAAKVQLIKRRTKQSDTEIIRSSLELYYETIQRGGTATPLEALSEFIGCAEGERDLSTTYKGDLTRSLSRKL